MKYDEFSFFNDQLADMLKDGLPLEGAIRNLSKNMGRSKLKGELYLLAEDLEKGKSLEDAVEERDLPDLYKRMLSIGAESNDFPSLLTSIADYYQRTGILWMKLRGVALYPACILVLVAVLSLFIQFMIIPKFAEIFETLDSDLPRFTEIVIGARFFPAAFFIFPLLLLLIGKSSKKARDFFRWRIPPMKDASLSQLASVLALSIKGGADLKKAVKLVQQMERRTAIALELAQWLKRMEDGHAKFDEIVQPSRRIPSLFIWLIASAGEDISRGLNRAAEIYQRRSVYKGELILYGSLPISIFLLGAIIFVEILAVYMPLFSVLSALY